MKAILEGLSYILLIILILSLPTILKQALHSEVPLAVVKSTSMIPTLNVGDIVVIVGVKPGEIRSGDIIIYDKRINVRDVAKAPYERVEDIGYIIIHRVVNVYVVDGKIYLVTKGDNNSFSDPWIVPEEGVLGRVLTFNIQSIEYPLKIPYIGYLSLYLHEG